MKKKFSWFLFGCLLQGIAVYAQPAVTESKALIKRIVPACADQFVTALMGTVKEDVFEIETVKNKKLMVKGHELFTFSLPEKVFQKKIYPALWVICLLALKAIFHNIIIHKITFSNIYFNRFFNRKTCF